MADENELTGHDLEMAANLSKKEIELQSISRLNIVVHPLWKTDPIGKNSITDAKFKNAREGLQQAILDNMLPDGENDVTCVIPHIGNTPQLRREDIHELKVKTKESEFAQWPSLYKKMVVKNKHGRNLMLGPNMVRIPDQRYVNEDFGAQQLVESLLKKGYSITENTKITVGGELLHPCVQMTIDRILALNMVHQVRVDRDSILTFSYLSGIDESSLEEERYKSFKTHFKDSGFSVEDDGRFITIKK